MSHWVHHVIELIDSMTFVKGICTPCHVCRCWRYLIMIACTGVARLFENVAEPLFLKRTHGNGRPNFTYTCIC